MFQDQSHGKLGTAWLLRGREESEGCRMNTDRVSFFSFFSFDLVVSVPHYTTVLTLLPWVAKGQHTATLHHNIH